MPPLTRKQIGALKRAPREEQLAAIRTRLEEDVETWYQYAQGEFGFYDMMNRMRDNHLVSPPWK